MISDDFDSIIIVCPKMTKPVIARSVPFAKDQDKLCDEAIACCYIWGLLRQKTPRNERIRYFRKDTKNCQNIFL